MRNLFESKDCACMELLHSGYSNVSKKIEDVN